MIQTTTKDIIIQSFQSLSKPFINKIQEKQQQQTQQQSQSSHQHQQHQQHQHQHQQSQSYRQHVPEPPLI